MTNPAAWHADPTGRHEHRYWDGERWTEHVADGGQAGIDPIESGPVQESAGAETGHPTSATQPVSDAAGGTVGGPSTSWQEPEAATQGYGHQPPATTQPSADARQPAPYAYQSSWDQPSGQTAGAGIDGIAIAALVVGILSLLTSWILIGAFGGVIALVLGFVALSRIKKSDQGGRGMAITGIVTGILSLIVAGLVIAFFGWFFSSSGGFGFIDEYVACVEAGNSEAFCDQQLEDGMIQRFGG